MMSLSLTTGWLPPLILLLAAAALVWLCFRTRAGGWRMFVLYALVAGGLAALLYVLAELVLHWWDASLPRYLYLYAGIGIFGLMLAMRVIFQRRAGLPGRLAAALVALLLLVAVASSANDAYQQYPTLETLVDPPSDASGPLPTPAGGSGTPAAIDTWTPPADLPAAGKTYETPIPESGSGYAANPAQVYLPPAYLADPGAVSLPVLVLIHGQPGSPQDWMTSGGLAEIMDNFASRHNGLAPIVVLPDASNASNDNWPLCMDTSVSASATYLAVDVPDWVRQHLAAGTAGMQQWAVGGYSYGGTCAMQLATNYPEVYPTFLDISGEREPTIPEGRQELVNRYFNGDQGAFADQNALDRLARMKFPDSAGIVVVGSDDDVYSPQGRDVYEAAAAAGMEVQFESLPGGHSWEVWRAGLENNLDWLCARLGIPGA